jgi:kynureninase
MAEPRLNPNDDLLRWRSEFPILATKTYLISNSLGAMPRTVFQRMQEYAETWATKGVAAWSDEWWEMPGRVGDEIAPLIGAGPGEVSMHPNVTTAHRVVLSCFEPPFPNRTNIVSEAMHFPSILYATQLWAEERGVELRLVPSDDGITVDTQRMVDAIDERTLLVSLSHVLFRSSCVQDVRSIAEKARAVGAPIIVDAYQSVGTMPVDVNSLGVDVLTGGVLKWLCGGPGGAFLYVRPELARTIQPRFTGWFAHQRPFAFEAAAMEYAAGATRFLTGTPSIPSLYAATEGPRIIREVGVEKIRSRSIHQTTLLVEWAKALGFPVRSPSDAALRGGAVTIDVPHGAAVSRALMQRGIVVDYREGAGVRVAPHFYNTDEEVKAALHVMKEILETGEHRRYQLSDSIVT